MEDEFKIFVDRLQDGDEEAIQETFPPSFLGVHEAELSFTLPVVVTGTALRSKGTLTLHFTISTEATLPCAVCNRNMQLKICVHDFYHCEDLHNIRSGVFNFKELLREAILIEIPYTAECNEGSCPERETMAKYLRKEKAVETHPFKNI